MGSDLPGAGGGNPIPSPQCFLNKSLARVFGLSPGGVEDRLPPAEGSDILREVVGGEREASGDVGRSGEEGGLGIGVREREGLEGVLDDGKDMAKDKKSWQVVITSELWSVEPLRRSGIKNTAIECLQYPKINAFS